MRKAVVFMKKFLQKTALLFLCLALLTGTAPLAEARDTLRVGIRPLGDGIVTEDAAGNFYGIETDYMQTLTSYAGMDVTFVPGTWEQNLARLRAGELDAIAGVAQSPELLQELLYSRMPIGFARGGRTLMAPVAPHQVTPLFYVMRKGDDARFGRLEQANDEMAANRPFFIEALARMYVDRQPVSVLRLTKEERDYLAEHPVLRAVAVANERPMAFIKEDGTFAGRVKKLADRIEQDLGVTLEIKAVSSYDEADAAIADGSADLLLNLDWDIAFAASKGMAAATGYRTDYYTAVTRRFSDLTHPVIAAVDSRTTDRMLRTRYADDQIRIYPTVDACFDAVKSGDADITFVRQETAQYAIWQGDFPDLVSDGTVAFERRSSIGVAERVSEHLLPILDKEINTIMSGAAQDSLAPQQVSEARRRSLRSLIYTYPLYFVGGVFLVGLLFVLVLWYTLRQRRRHMDEIQHIVDTDSYTGLRSHAWIEHQFEALTRDLPVDGRAWYFIVFGVVNFDAIVGTYGQEVVTGMIRRFTEQLGEVSWAKACASHASAGHVLCLAQAKDLDILIEAVRHQKEVQEYVRVGDMNVHVPIHAGIAAVGFPPEERRKIFEHANLAMHETNDVQVYNDAMQASALERSQIESLQQAALDREEFVIWYQPKYDLKTKKCIGAEALVRWKSKELGFLPPGKFIPLFERNGFITKLDFYNLVHVMKMQRDRRAKGLPVVPVSVNQSRFHMQEKGYLQRMAELVGIYSTDGVELELTETAFDLAGREQRENALAVVTELKRLGFRIDMDDFGSGYSDLTLLDALPLDVMKLDRSLLLASENSERMRSVLARMTDLGHALGMTVICEGIETEEQEQMLIDCGCEHGQGYLYGKPMPQEEFESFLAAHL